jgi:hypothetical protein
VADIGPPCDKKKTEEDTLFVLSAFMIKIYPLKVTINYNIATAV